MSDKEKLAHMSNELGAELSSLGVSYVIVVLTPGDALGVFSNADVELQVDMLKGALGACILHDEKMEGTA